MSLGVFVQRGVSRELLLRPLNAIHARCVASSHLIALAPDETSKLTRRVVLVSKKDKKNGKDGGGVVAAVTKHAAKFSWVPSTCLREGYRLGYRLTATSVIATPLRVYLPALHPPSHSTSDLLPLPTCRSPRRLSTPCPPLPSERATRTR